MGLSVDTLTWSTFGPAGDPTRWSHSGIAVLPDGRVVYTEPGGGALLIVGGSEVARVPMPTTDGHGLTLVDGGLLVSDPGTGNGDGQVLRVDLVTGAADALPSVSARWRPTSTAVDPSGTIWIADGYGESLVHALDPSGAVRTLDGSATGTVFDCPHGVVIDDRGAVPLVLVADRVNRRLVWFRLDGTLDRMVDDPLLTSPSSLAVRGDDVLVTDLYGALLAVDRNDVVTAVLPIDDPVRDDAWPNVLRDGELVAPTVRDGLLHSPHGIAVGPDGAVYLTEWFLGGRQVRLTPA